MILLGLVLSIIILACAAVPWLNLRLSRWQRQHDRFIAAAANAGNATNGSAGNEASNGAINGVGPTSNSGANNGASNGTNYGNSNGASSGASNNNGVSNNNGANSNGASNNGSNNGASAESDSEAYPVSDIDYVHTPWADCKAHCDARPGCTSYSIHNAAETPGVGCWLMTALGKPSAASAPLILYKQCQFKDVAIPLGPGAHQASDLAAVGLPGPSVSSLKVAPGHIVTLFSEDGFKGEEVSTVANVGCLTELGASWANGVASVKVAQVVQP
jgi:hypothetical protein